MPCSGGRESRSQSGSESQPRSAISNRASKQPGDALPTRDPRRALGPLLPLYEHVWAEVEGRIRFRSKRKRPPPSTDRWYPPAARRYRPYPLGGGPVGIAVPSAEYHVGGPVAHSCLKPDVDRPRSPIPRRPLPAKAKHPLLGPVPRPLPRPPCNHALASESAPCRSRPSANASSAGCGQSAASPTGKPLDTRPGPMPSPARVGPDASQPAAARLPRLAPITLVPEHQEDQAARQARWPRAVVQEENAWWNQRIPAITLPIAFGPLRPPRSQ